MTDAELLYEFNSLPDDLKKQVRDFVAFLKQQHGLEPKPNAERKPRFGSLKGKIKLSEDFDEPLEDFKDYM